MEAYRSNLHTHTVFSDGANTPEEMVIAAIDKGFASLGFSEHSPMPYVSECAMKAEDINRYFTEIKRLRDKYAGVIEIYLGIESDALLPFDKGGLDYVIGSVHDIRDRETGTAYTIDWLPEIFSEAIDVIGKGDVWTLVNRYYEMVGEMLTGYKPDILGHPDLITKLNADSLFFDEGSALYKRIQENIVERISVSGVIAEVNTGGISRGYKKGPYPSEYMLSLLRERGVPVILASDAHSADTLDYGFTEALMSLKRLKFRSVMMIQKGTFTEMEI